MTKNYLKITKKLQARCSRQRHANDVSALLELRTHDRQGRRRVKKVYQATRPGPFRLVNLTRPSIRVAIRAARFFLVHTTHIKYTK
jgi:hypothetical protein